MKKPKLTKWDTVDYLKTEADMVGYLDACIEQAGDDTALITKALGNIARARGMSKLARSTGISRDGLYKALSSEGNPEFSTILKVTSALGLRLSFEPSMA